MFEAFDGDASFPARASGDGANGDESSDSTTPGTTPSGPVVADSSLDVEDVLLPGGAVAGGIVAVLAALGLRGGGDGDDPTGGDGSASETAEGGDARADGGSRTATQNGGGRE